MRDLSEHAKKKAETRNNKIRAIKRRQGLHSLLLLAALMTCVLLVYLVYASGVLTLRGIAVSGNERLSDEEIKETSGLEEGAALLGLPTRRAERQLRDHPWIKDVSISRKLPNSLAISVRERETFASVSFEGVFYLIDDEGCVMARRAGMDEEESILITDLPIDEVKVGEYLDLPELNNALDCLDSLDETTRESIVLVSAATVELLSLYNEDDVEIIYGPAEDTDIKNAALNQIMEDNDTKEGKLIMVDLRVAASPVVKRLEVEP